MNDNEFWFSVIMLVGVIFLIRMITTAVMAGIRAAHDSRQYWGKNQHGVPPMFQKMADKAMADRDQEITTLKERVEVLEKIVTDQHNQSKARELADEIDKLRTPRD